MAIVKNYRELIAWQLAEEFKKAVFELVDKSERIQLEHKFRSQLIEAACSVSKNIAEGFRRFKPRSIDQFFGYALASLHEAEDRIRDAIQLRYFAAADCARALNYAKRCTVATIRFKKSQRSRAKPAD
ncbi:MAG TPA: four helix bundle protein [Vicinamibacterales bacterium]|nr:four helix bundle protein [Vicinamibacterales bacterium]